jgi:hypothetical protein
VITLAVVTPEVEQLRAALDGLRAAVRSDYRAACAASNDVIAAVGDADAPVTRDGRTGR